MNPHSSRVAAVFGKRQGSGYLLGPRLVLTAAHVVGRQDSVEAIVVGGVGKVRCTVVWRRKDSACDAALLVAPNDIVSADVLTKFAPLRWGELIRLDTQENCQAIGFPLVQRDERGNLESEQLVGRVKPGSSLVLGRYVLESSGPPPQSAGGGSPWAGLSGAGLFCQGALIGVVTAAPTGWSHGRVEAVPVRVIADDPAFQRAVEDHGGPKVAVTALDELSGPERKDRDFEVGYRRYVANRFAKIETLGHDSDTGRIVWPLDTAFLALELAATTPRNGRPAAEVAPGRRVHAALEGHTRILLHGAAGCGKTTLMHWLAVHAAQGDLPRELGALQGRVPFVIPLRALTSSKGAPRLETLLEELEYPAALGQPEQWLTGLLEQGRGLLLIDGIDEIRHDLRPRVRSWLERLLDLYPTTAVVATSRPSAVHHDWLAGYQFAAFSVLPMSPADVGTFIDRWFTALSQSNDWSDAWHDVEYYTTPLRWTVDANSSLMEMAASPRLCALICALWLQQQRTGSRDPLPHDPLQLHHAAAFDMTVRRRAIGLRLYSRDVARSVHATEGIDLTLEQQTGMLQALAVWMLLNGASDLSPLRAQRILEQDCQAQLLEISASQKLPGNLSYVADRVLQHLLIRAGSLYWTPANSIAFEHSTFRDYFAAAAIVTKGHFGFLVNHAHDPQYTDVVHMALGHCSQAEADELLLSLAKRGDREPEHRTWLHLLTTACLRYAEHVGPHVRMQVLDRTRALTPPHDDAAADLLAEAGPDILNLLPGPDDLTVEEARAVVLTACKIGGPAAATVLERFATHADPIVRERVDWGRSRITPLSAAL
ncbi:NACHT domain-containing protein [Streptomyces sp. NPDC001663]|uniref:NACHT domain-containing protein n=1 Tax=unclassified Streptomyces TaxID=2593676 RepID=UPI00331E538E